MPGLVTMGSGAGAAASVPSMAAPKSAAWATAESPMLIGRTDRRRGGADAGSGGAPSFNVSMPERAEAAREGLQQTKDSWGTKTGTPGRWSRLCRKQGRTLPGAARRHAYKVEVKRSGLLREMKTRALPSEGG